MSDSEVARVARLVDMAPGDADLLRVLDGVAPYGLDPAAPTPGPFRGGGATRSNARGAGVGVIEARLRFNGEVVPCDDDGGEMVDLAVNAAGEVIFSMLDPGPRRIRALDLAGRVSPLSPELPGRTPYLAASWTVAVDRWEKTIHAQDVTGRRSSTGAFTFAVIGCGHAFTFGPSSGKVVIEARPLADLARTRWRHEVEGSINRTADLVVARGARIAIVTSVPRPPEIAGGLLAVIDVATGERVETVKLPVCPGASNAIFAARTGVTFVGLIGRTVAVSRGDIVWSSPTGTLSVFGLAGAEQSVLVGKSLEDDGRRALHGLDARDGRRLWSTRPGRWLGSPQIDGTGRIFARREGDLVVLDPATGQDQLTTRIADSLEPWGFAIAGAGRTVVVRRADASGGELIVIR